VSRPLTYESNGYWAIDCPQCRQEVRVDLHGDRLSYSCRAQCGADIAALVDKDKIRDELREAATSRNGNADSGPAERLTTLYGLATVGLEVVRARVVGDGGTATVYLYLSDGFEIVFERLRDMAKPQTVLVELAACTGARPKLDQTKCIDAIALIREIAEHELTATIDELSREWGLTFLQSADAIDLDMDDQTERWGAFSELDRRDPVAAPRSAGTSVASASVVLRHLDGTRYVRAGWFRAHVRQDDVTVSPQEIAQRMERVGWRRPGTEGRVKATRPGHQGALLWRFYVVDADWETKLEQVTE
jgi:hypothetical protein